MKLMNIIVTLLLVTLVNGFYECGRPSYRPARSFYSHRIVGGWEAIPHSIPWQVYMLVSIYSNMVGSCGGTLIQLRPKNYTTLVVSAAHCVYHDGYARPDQIQIVVGAHNLRDIYETSQRVIPVRNFIHHQYNPYTKENDLVLIKLKEAVPYSDYTRPACLPMHGEELPYGKICIVSGWGTLAEGGRSPSLLQMVNVKIIPKEQCHIKRKHYDKMFCAGWMEGRKDSCKGDSGGPLVCKVNKRWTLYGVVSFGTGCARPNAPGVYVNLPNYVNWIIEASRKLKHVPDLSGRQQAYSPAELFGYSKFGTAINSTSWPSSTNYDNQKPTLTTSHTINHNPTTSTITTSNYFFGRLPLDTKFHDDFFFNPNNYKHASSIFSTSFLNTFLKRPNPKLTSAHFFQTIEERSRFKPSRLPGLTIFAHHNNREALNALHKQPNQIGTTTHRLASTAGGSHIPTTTSTGNKKKESPRT